MIHMIKWGQFKQYFFRCKHCKCEFCCDERDLVDNSYIICPECGEKLYVEESKR